MDPQAAIDAHLQPQAPPEPAPDPQAAVDAHLQAPPPPTLVDALLVLVAQKYAVLLAYAAYGDQLRTTERDGLVKHFDEHIADERAWVYQIHRMIAARGGTSYPQGVTIPTPPLAAPRPAIEALASMEAGLLDRWAEAGAAAEGDPSLGEGERAAVVAALQEGARIDLAHLEDMRRYLGAGA